MFFFIIHFLNQGILNYMLKYTPVKTNMNTSQRYCTTKIDFYPITNVQLCCTWNFSHLVRRIHNENEISAVGGEDGQKLGEKIYTTHLSLIWKVPVRAQMHKALHPATVHSPPSIHSCKWQHCKKQGRGDGECALIFLYKII